MCATITNNDLKYFIEKLEWKLELSPGSLVGENRVTELTELRYAIYKLFHEDLNLSLKRTGRLFNRDHSTVHNGLKQINETSGKFSIHCNELYYSIKAEFEKFRVQLQNFKNEEIVI